MCTFCCCCASVSAPRADLSETTLSETTSLTPVLLRDLRFILHHFIMGARDGERRLSSNSQDYRSQVAALKAAGCDRVYSEKMSGKSTKGRRELDKLMKALLPGDVVHVVKLDRLARSTRDLANILHDLDEKGCGFTSMHGGWYDSSTPVGRLMITVMSGIAEFERELIRGRCEEGIS